jgi:2-oxoglutarate dehydrogenase E1 component
VEGIARAKADHKVFHETIRKVAPILIHGDASIAGQGIVYEVSANVTTGRGIKQGAPYI